jgi:uncharacterized protein YebE (UPF0316 family)
MSLGMAALIAYLVGLSHGVIVGIITEQQEEKSRR